MLNRHILVLITLVAAGCAEAQSQAPGGEVEVGATFDPNASPEDSITVVVR